MPTEWTPTICLYHRGCMDGITAAAAVWHRFGDTVKFYAMGYGDKVPPVTKDDRVLMVDFSLKRDALIKLSYTVQSIVVLDHHATSEADLSEFAHSAAAMTSLGVAPVLAKFHHDGVNAIIAFFDNNKSGARLAWEFCHTAGVPHSVLLVEDRDLWRFVYGDDTKHYHRYLCSHDIDALGWANWPIWTDQQIGDGIKIGAVLQRDFDKTVRAVLANTHWKNIDGHKVPVVNVPYFMASDVAHQLLLRHTDAPFAATYFVRGDSNVVYSLRSDEGRLDVSVIAAKFGGGGHRNASGFTIPH